jgi:8-hydroxy-5-deazaflavin:NADPH oxidoreductase
MKRIGIIGSGIVGKTLAAGFIKHGYAVMMGTRDSNKQAELAKEFNNKMKTGNFSETSAFAELIVLAVPGLSAKEALKLCEVENICGKTIIDATNPIDQKPPDNGVLRYFTSLDESLMEQLQQAFPEVRFVKAFNSVGNAFMVNPDFGGIQPSMFICGNNTDSKKDVTEILTTFGWITEDMGGAEAARAIEPLCMLWCIPGLRENKWTHAFKLLKK